MSSAPVSRQATACVVITGLGLVTPLGVGAGEFFGGLRGGHSALRQHPALSRLPGKLGDLHPTATPQAPWAGRVQEFGAAAAIDAGRRRRMPRLAQMCVVAAQQALGLLSPGGQPTAAPAGALSHYGAERVAMVLGTGLGTLELTIEFQTGYIESGVSTASPALFPYTVMNTPAAIAAMELQLLGANITVNHRELSAHEAVASAVDLLLCDRADAVLCGGCDELGPWLQHACAQLDGVPADSPTATPPMRPYDRQRSGPLLGEGAVLLLLERAEGARRRGARPLAAVSGIGRAGDDRPRIGWQRASGPPAAEGAARAIAEAIAEAGLRPTDLDFIAGGGNGTALDELETRALRQSLGAAAERVPIASILGQCGDWMTSSAARLAAALYALSEQALPGTALCSEPDPQASLPGLVLLPRPATAPVRHVLVPALAQGGGNAALILSQAG